MYLHGAGIGTASSSGNAGAPQAPAAAPQKPPALPVPAPAMRHSVQTLVAAAALPGDALSASLVSFARFFSLPLKPGLMAAMRRQALSPPVRGDGQPVLPAAPGTQAASGAAAFREALALAACAAESKGVELTRAALEAYAAAVNPDRQKRPGGDGGNRRRQPGEGGKGAAVKPPPVTAGALREAALEAMRDNPLAAMLNSLTGNDGRRWIVLPFEFDEAGRLYSVSLRVLTETADGTGLMVLDIAENPGGGKDAKTVRRVFSLESRAGCPFRLSACLSPAPSPSAAAALTAALAGITGVPAERVAVGPLDVRFPAESLEPLPCVRETV